MKAKRVPAPKKAAAPKVTGKKASTSEKICKDAFKDVDKVFNQMMKKYKPNPTGWPSSGVTSDDFAKAMARFLPLVKQLQETSLFDAFNILMYLGDHAYGDVGWCFKASGFGETDIPFKEMDDCMVELIQLRCEGEEEKGASSSGFELKLSTDDFWGKGDATRDLPGGEERPSKQERGWLVRARIDGLKTMFVTRRARRETTDDWAGNALNDLAETRRRIEMYGIGEHFFDRSIGHLASWKGVVNAGVQLAIDGRSKGTSGEGQVLVFHFGVDVKEQARSC